MPSHFIFNRLSFITFCWNLISPLNSIISEQVERYRENIVHISESFVNRLKIHGSICITALCNCDEDVQKFVSGKFLYAVGHPEQFLEKSLFKELAIMSQKQILSHIVIDEAHCVDKWGSEFRRDFSRLQELRSILPKAKILALTATASGKTQEKIKSSLLMKNAITIQTCIVRRNIKLSVRSRPNYTVGSEESFLETIEPFVDELRNKRDLFPKTVVYCNLKWCGAGYEECIRKIGSQAKRLVAQYHAPCTNEMKQSVVQSMSRDGCTRLLFATEAYSMGTDTPNIRRIIHFGVPKSVESYLQEVGRAGRDMMNAEATMFFNNNDVAKNVNGLDRRMAEFCKSVDCRWKFLCNYFGCPQEFDVESHLCCDNCTLRCTCQVCNLAKKSSPVDGQIEASKSVQSKKEKPQYSSTRNSLLTKTLSQYFCAENSVLSCPDPVLFSGLSETLATEISIDPRVAIIATKCDHLNKTYLMNILSIVESFIKRADE